jgi:hypothetical protein
MSPRCGLGIPSRPVGYKDFAADGTASRISRRCNGDHSRPESGGPCKSPPRPAHSCTRKGKPVSVIIPIKHYQELLERAEDAEDIAWLKRARRKPLRYRPLEDYLAERRNK